MVESFIVLISATALLLGSPGPAPLALAATGATFGIKKGIPFLAGILVGLSVAIVGATAGLAALFSQFPSFRVICQVIGGAYILYIAFKIASAPVIDSHKTNIAPNFKDGFILNLLNPKAYAAFLAIFSQFLLSFSDSTIGYIVTGFTCLMVAALVDTLWLMFGGLLRPIFSNPKQARIIRVVFAILMVIAVVYALV
ncbi:LysE family translocator [Thalassotalea sp. M1531]|uniref:LysE family translocator n=1 Tax=Thalassotalea algicola TaxID=2716224 RepID=A0A7Y0Q5F3_9GAMM|nr:LysE family translocator [Thalassotalea algicola]NMP30036.1 LysE family translocator [Thalassotalea algicola]